METLKAYSQQFGGKVGGLVALKNLGIPVPDGKVLPSESLTLLESLTHEEIRQHPIFQELSQYASSFWKYDKGVILRSSANQEDSILASFAGQFRSSNKIRNSNELLEGLVTVLEGFKHERIAIYQKQLGSKDDLIAGNVIIQEFLDPYISGVIFGCNPINGDADVIQISFTEGFADRLVGGAESGYNLIMDKKSHSIIRGGIPSKLAGFKDSLNQISAIVNTLEEATPHHFPDLEFVLLPNKKMYCVQWRPITTVARIYTQEAKGEAFGREILGEWLSDRISYLFESLFLPEIVAESVCEINHQLGFRVKEPTYLVSEGFVYLRQEINPSLIFSLIKLPLFVFRGVEYWKREAFPAISKIDSYAILPKTNDKEEIIHEVEDLVNLNSKIIAASIATAPIAIGLEAVLRGLVNGLFDVQSPLDYLSFIKKGKSKSLRANDLLVNIGNTVRKLPEFSSIEEQLSREEFSISIISSLDVQSQIEAFLNEYGHLSESFDIQTKTLREQTHWMNNAIQMTTNNSNIDNNNGEQKHTHLIKVKTPYRLLSPLINPTIRTLARLVSQYQTIRDDRAFYAQYGWDKIRLRIILLADTLLEQNVIPSRNHVFGLSWKKIKSLSLEKTPVKNIHPLQFNIRDTTATIVPQLSINSSRIIKWLRKKIWYSHNVDISKNALVGQAGSPGKVTAPVFVANTLSDLENLSVGDILVCTVTTPAWTSVYGLLGGVITEIGNPLSHAAIVAREYNIPCVVGVTAAKKKLRTGQTVTLDGSVGIIIFDNDTDSSKGTIT